MQRVLRRHPVAVLSVVALIATTVGIVVASPPPSEQPEEFHGRTWLYVSSPNEASPLVLVNGLSGMIEGRATTDGSATPSGAEFVGATTSETLLGTPSAVTVVDNGAHGAVSRAGIDGTSSVLTGGRVLVAGREAEVYPDDLVGDPEPVEGPDPVESAPPVVDGAGRGWYLGKSGRDLTAERLDPSRAADRVVRRRRLDDPARRRRRRRLRRRAR